MRNLNDLLYLFLEEENQKLFKHGICHWIYQLCIHKKINYIEYNILLDYIRASKISRFSSIDALLAPSRYYWRPGKLKPRLKWIKKQIKKYEEH